jgi:hypothetical protein
MEVIVSSYRDQMNEKLVELGDTVNTERECRSTLDKGLMEVSISDDIVCIVSPVSVGVGSESPSNGLTTDCECGSVENMELTLDNLVNQFTNFFFSSISTW